MSHERTMIIQFVGFIWNILASRCWTLFDNVVSVDAFLGTDGTTDWRDVFGDGSAFSLSALIDCFRAFA